MQPRAFLGMLIEPFIKSGLFFKNSLDKSIIIPLGLTGASSSRNTAIQRKMFGSGMTALIIQHE